MIVNEREKTIYQQGFMAGSNAAQAAIKAAERRAEVAERALDKAVKLAYKIRTDFDVLSCSSCEFGYAIDTCKKIGLYDDCENRWKEKLLQQAEREVEEEKKDDKS